MTIKEIYEDAERKLDKGEITIGEFESMVSTKVPTWVPCSERLPEPDVRVLICVPREGFDNYADESFITVDYRFHSEEYGDCWSKFDSAIAWMPLPEMYKQQQHNTAFNRQDVLKALNNYFEDCMRVSRRKYEQAMLDAISMDIETIIKEL